MLNRQEQKQALKEAFLAEYALDPRRPDLDGGRLVVHVAQDGLTIERIAVRLKEGLAGTGGVRTYDALTP